MSTRVRPAVSGLPSALLFSALAASAGCAFAATGIDGAGRGAAGTTGAGSGAGLAWAAITGIGRIGSDRSHAHLVPRQQCQ